jgi:hypothetical protein
MGNIKFPVALKRQKLSYGAQSRCNDPSIFLNIGANFVNDYDMKDIKT